MKQKSKPAGMTVHRSTKTPRRQLVLSTSLKRQLARKVYPVHRLDHRTSGAILFAFDSNTCGNLHKALTFGESRVVNGDLIQGSRKEYIALLRVDWKRKFGDQVEVVVDKPLDVKGVSKEAKTVFRIIASSSGLSDKHIEETEAGFLYPPAACSLVLCIPETGRTHQIRRHAFAMGCPIIGDREHGDTKINRWWRENRNLNRLFLHCLTLDLPPLGIMQTLDGNYNTEAQSDELIEMELLDENGATNMKEVKMPTYSYDRISCTAPLPDDLALVLNHHEMSTLWKDARTKEPRLALVPFDTKGGTYGRNFRASL